MTEEIPKNSKDDYGFGIKHPTTQPEKRALILTHPFERFNADEQEITDYLKEGRHGYEKVFYIPKTGGRVPLPVADINNPDNNRQSRLPPGFLEGYYERGLEEDSWGELTDQEAEKLLEEYDRIDVGGAQLGHCVDNTLESLVEKRLENERYQTTELDINYDIAYGAV